MVTYLGLRTGSSTRYATQEITGEWAEYLLLYCIPPERCQLMLLSTVCDNLIEYISVKNNFNRMYPRFSRKDLLKNILSCYPIDPRKYSRNSNILASKWNLLGFPVILTQPYQKKKKTQNSCLTVSFVYWIENVIYFCPHHKNYKKWQIF